MQQERGSSSAGICSRGPGGKPQRQDQGPEQQAQQSLLPAASKSRSPSPSRRPGLTGPAPRGGEGREQGGAQGGGKEHERRKEA